MGRRKFDETEVRDAIGKKAANVFYNKEIIRSIREKVKRHYVKNVVLDLFLMKAALFCFGEFNEILHCINSLQEVPKDLQEKTDQYSQRIKDVRHQVQHSLVRKISG